MKSISNVWIALTILLSFSVTVGNAQIKNAKTETVKIYGNCGTCKKTIEKAGNLKNVAKVDWNQDTQIATLTYDPIKTNQEEILKRVALAGYDSDSFLAPDEAYSNLPGCCKYERVNKTVANTEAPTTEMGSKEHSDVNMTLDTQASQQVNKLTAVFDNYFAVKDALVKTDGAMASDKAKNLLTAIMSVKMDMLSMDVHMVWMKVLDDLTKSAEHIADTKDVSKQRDNFMSLSKNMYEVMKVSKYEQPVYYQFCPMADNGKGANWLSMENTVKNPYFGSQMLTCGKTVDTIK